MLAGSTNRYAYTGREWDSDLELYHYRARMYSATEARFISRDPIGFKGSEWNLYEYGDGAPVHKVDPSGEAWWIIIGDRSSTVVAGTMARSLEMSDKESEAWVSASSRWVQLR